MRRKRGLKREIKRLRLKKEVVFSSVSVLFFIGGFLTILSFAQRGSLLVLINNNLKILFGWGAVFLPFLLFSAGLMFSNLYGQFGKYNLFLGGLLVAIASVGLTQAGIAGSYFWDYLKTLFTSFGAIILLLGTMIVGFLVLFESSLEEFMLFLIGLGKFLKKILGGLEKKKTSFENLNLPEPILNSNQQEESRQEIKRKEEGSIKTKEAKIQSTSLLLEGKIVSNDKTSGSIKWQYPPLSLLVDSLGGPADRGDINKNADTIEKTLESFGIRAEVVEVNKGPAVTQYALEIARGTKLSKITALSNDLALALAAPTGQIRIEAPIPGRSLVGVEVPNRSLEIVPLKKILTSSQMEKAKSKLAIGLGLDVSGKPVVADIAKMPHVLIAGSTGSGKSVAINSFIATLLFRTTPAELKLILVDPKRVELTQYNGIPHLLTPVIVEPEKVISALKWAIQEMERRYQLFAQIGARNIESYNQNVSEQTLPYIVIVIDELAEIMFFSPSEVEDAITRLAQMARATGIHLIISTQRPSVDVITGLIKANIPCRIAFNVSSMVDSRVIIDMPGAEKLLGKGDMLYIPPDQAKPTRIQGTFVSDREINNLIEFLKKTGIAPQYTEEVVNQYKGKSEEEFYLKGGTTDPLFEEAVRIVCQHKKASTSLLQRRFSIGYSRAARILDQLEEAGIVGPPEGSKPRDVFPENAEQFLTKENQSAV